MKPNLLQNVILCTDVLDILQGIPKYCTHFLFALFSAFTEPRNKSIGISEICMKFPEVPEVQRTFQDPDIFFRCFKDLEGSLRYPLGREGVFAPGGLVCLAHARQKVSYIVGLTALRLAFFMGYE